MIEMSITLSLMVVFALVAERMFHFSATVMREAPAAMNASQHMAHAMNAIQRSIWLAEDCTVISSTQLLIALPGGRQKQVQIDGSRMTMTAGDTEDAWNDLPGRVTFHKEGAFVVATVTSAHSEDEIWLPMVKPWAEGMAP